MLNASIFPYFVNMAAIELFAPFVLTTDLLFLTGFFSKTALADPLFFISVLSLFAIDGGADSFEIDLEREVDEAESDWDFLRGAAEVGGGAIS